MTMRNNSLTIKRLHDHKNVSLGHHNHIIQLMIICQMLSECALYNTALQMVVFKISCNEGREIQYRFVSFCLNVQGLRKK